MRKILLILLCLLLVGCGTVEVETREMPIEASPVPDKIVTHTPKPTIAPTPIPTPEPTTEPTSEPVQYSYQQSYSPSSYSFDPSTARAGRFYVPSAGINVGLGEGDNAQQIVDADDSAWYTQYFDDDDSVCYAIADHCNQGFASLTSVKNGDSAYVTNADGSVTNLRCKEVIDGLNNGWLTDKNGEMLDFADGDYVAFTCHGGGDGVRIVIFEEVVEQEVAVEQVKQEPVE